MMNTRRILPGMRISLSITLFYLSILVLIPLIALFTKASSLTGEQLVKAVWTERARAAYLLTFGAAAIIGLARDVAQTELSQRLSEVIIGRGRGKQRTDAE